MTILLELADLDGRAPLVQAQAAGVRARLTADGRLEPRGPPSAVAFGRELRAREGEVVAALRQEVLDGLLRVLGWRPDRPRRGSPRTQGNLDLDDVLRSPNGHPLEQRTVRKPPCAGTGSTNAGRSHQSDPWTSGEHPEAATAAAAKRGAG